MFIETIKFNEVFGSQGYFSLPEGTWFFVWWHDIYDIAKLPQGMAWTQHLAHPPRRENSFGSVNPGSDGESSVIKGGWEIPLKKMEMLLKHHEMEASLWLFVTIR